MKTGTQPTHMSVPTISAGRAGLTAALFAALLGGCAVGPDYQRPTLPAAKAYATQALPETTSGSEAQRFVAGKAIQADWWTLFESPQLTALIEKAFAANPTIEAAQAALRAAQYTVQAQRGYFFPTIQASYSPSRTKIAGNVGGNSPGVQGNGSVISTTQNTPASQGGTAPFNQPVVYNFHTAQFSVGYTPDIFGLNRRLVEAFEAQTRIQALQLEAAYVTLASNVVAAAVQEALLRRQLELVEAIVADNVRAVELVGRQFKNGYASQLDLSLQENALAQARQLLPPLQKQLEQTRHLLASLIGGTPDQAMSETFTLDSLKLPRELPLSLPSDIIDQRPDVRAAEEQLHIVTAQLGAAIANRLPQFTIDATWGGAASQFTQMFWSSGKFFNIAGTLAQTIFDGGTLKYRQRAMEETVKQTTAQYQSTVLNAYQNVADAVYAVHSDAAALSAASDAERTAKTSLGLLRKQFQRGYIDRLALIAAEQNYRQSALALAQAQATRLGDTALLFQALGGGWWNKPAQDAKAN
ncbi:efflux transporter outer membrane subunit [Propionivibrio dicarboxylicus]|uniref:Efflux transporter, outer membrane factor (OMF) lipoprotein, NodT family n=1 Tax=Propionivibrio dicarboxylicus TaxID=83767 RepID=A0A1G8JH97_9RHOO|nr:efflux transporter outer membrane subunit [Propionivibrio dicarboxylicus]SDI30000.1 efflux transporter, outer membrane factor (OMF) lipoprotein, NodT family [Propionivibrio dicarboxylicus]